MSKWIEVDALKSTRSINSGNFNSMETIREWIDKAPSIEIVRCGECKWYHDSQGCFFSTAEVEEDGFCSYGEAKTEPQTDCLWR